MRTTLFGLLLLLCGTGQAFAQPSVMIDELTSTEVRDAVAAGKTTLILYTGGYHESMYGWDVNSPVAGPRHDAIVVGKHNYLVAYLVRRVAEEVGALAYGPIIYTPNGTLPSDENGFTGEKGPKPGHMEHPGTLTLRPETYRRLLDDIASSAIISGGFKNVVFLNDNGGADQNLQSNVEAIKRKWAPRGVGVFFFQVYREAKAECAKKLATLDIPKGMREAFECNIPIDDAAEMLAIDKEGKLVRPGKLPFPPIGARIATPELGRELLEQKVRIAVDHIIKEVPGHSMSQLR